MIRRILLVAGGTGGHVWPAIAFGDWVKRHHPEVHLGYLTGMRSLELEMYRSAGLDPHIISLEGSPLGAPRGQRLRRWRQQFQGLSQSAECFREERPDACVLFGGYLCFPSLLVAKMRGISALVHEQNAWAGKTARLASRMGVPVASGWDRCAPFAEGRFTPVGVPVRSFHLVSRQEAWQRLGLEGEAPSAPIVAVMAGSLASHPLFLQVQNLAREEAFASWTFLFLGASSCLDRQGNRILLPRRWDVEFLYSVADLAVLRAGASTLTEVRLAGLPALVVPWRHATGDHQRANALQFCRDNVGQIWDETTGTEEELATQLKRLEASRQEHPRSGRDMYNAAERICSDLWRVLIAPLGERRGLL